MSAAAPSCRTGRDLPTSARSTTPPCSISTSVPEHLIIAGGSYIGLEFAQVFRRFGARVTVVEYGDRLIFREDEDVSQLARDLLEKEGVEILVGARDFAVARSGDRRRAHGQRRRREANDRGQPSLDGDRPQAQHRRPRARQSRRQDRRARLHRRRRRTAHQCRGRLGDGRRQRARRLHPYVLQRF